MSNEKFTDVFEAYMRMRDAQHPTTWGDSSEARAINEFFGYRYDREMYVRRPKGRPRVLTEEEKAARKLTYEMSWRDRNPDKVKAMYKRWYAKNRDAVLARARAKRAERKAK